MLHGALTSFQYEENNLAEIQIKQDRDEKYTALIDSSLHPSRFVSKTNSPRQSSSIKSEDGGKQKKDKKDRLAPLGDSISIGYLETWLNNALGQAESQGIPGVMKYPEHKKPLSRYELDLYILQQVGLSTNDIDQLYRGLFVHSKGVFQMVMGISKKVQNKANHPNLPSVKNAENKQAYILANIWRVYQILLEYSSTSDYEMITQNMEKRSSELEFKMKEELKILEQQFVEKDKELQTRMLAVKEECAILEKQKIQFEHDKVAAIEGSAKAMKKLEEETVTRIRFEQKLNSLHMVNHDVDSERKLYQDKFEKLTVQHKDLLKKYIELQTEIESLDNFKTKAQYKLTGQEKIREDFGKQNGQLTSYVKQIEAELLELRECKKENMFQIQSLSSELTQVSLRATQTANDLESTQKYADQIKGFYTQHQEKQSSQSQRIEDLKKETSQQSLLISTLTTDNKNLAEDNSELETELMTLRQDFLETKFKKDLYEQKYNAQLLITDSHKQNQEEFQKFTEQAHEQYLVLELNKLEQDRNLNKQINQANNLKKEKENAEDLLKKIKRQEIFRQQRAQQAQEKVQVMVIQNEQASREKEELIMEHGKKLRIQQQKSSFVEESRDEINVGYQKIKDELEGMKIQFKACRESLVIKTEGIVQLQSQLEYVQGELQNTQEAKKKQLEEHVDKNDEMENAQAKNKEMKKEVRRFDERIKKLVQDWRQKVEDKQSELVNQKMANEDTLSRMQQVDEKYKQLQEEYETQVLEMKYLSRKYIAFLIHKGWSKIRQEKAAEDLANSYAEIGAKDNLIKNQELQNSDLCDKIDKLEVDLKYLSKRFSEQTKDLKREEQTVRTLKEDLTSKTEKVKYLMDKYVNIERLEQGTSMDLVSKSMTSQTTTIKMSASSTQAIERPEMYEFYNDPETGVQKMRQPGESLPENVVKEIIVLKTKNICNDEYLTARNKVDVTRLMRKFKVIAKMVGKLKAAQNLGTVKRTAAEEAVRLAELAKESQAAMKEESRLAATKDPSVSQLAKSKTASHPTVINASVHSLSNVTLEKQDVNQFDKTEDVELFKKAKKKLEYKKQKALKEKQSKGQLVDTKQTVSDIKSDDFVSESFDNLSDDQNKLKVRKSKVLYGKNQNLKTYDSGMDSDGDTEAERGKKTHSHKSIGEEKQRDIIKKFFVNKSILPSQSQDFVDFKNFLRQINQIQEFSEFAEIQFKVTKPKNFKAFQLVNKKEIEVQRQEALTLIDNLKQISENERSKYSNKIKEYFKQALQEILPNEQKQHLLNDTLNPDYLSRFNPQDLKNVSNKFERYKSNSGSPVILDGTIDNQKLHHSVMVSNFPTSQYSSFNDIRKKKNLNELGKLHAQYIPRNQMDLIRVEGDHLHVPQKFKNQSSYQEKPFGVNEERLTGLQKRNTHTINAKHESSLSPRRSSFDSRAQVSKEIYVLENSVYPYMLNKHGLKTKGNKTNEYGSPQNKKAMQSKISDGYESLQNSTIKQVKPQEYHGFQTDVNFYQNKAKETSQIRTSSQNELNRGPLWLSRQHDRAQRDMDRANIQASRLKVSYNKKDINEGIQIQKLLPNTGGASKFVDANSQKKGTQAATSLETTLRNTKTNFQTPNFQYGDLITDKNNKKQRIRQTVNQSVVSAQSNIQQDTVQTQQEVPDSDREHYNVIVPNIFNERQSVYTHNNNFDLPTVGSPDQQVNGEFTVSATRGEDHLKPNFTDSNNKRSGVSTPHDVEINSQKFDDQAEKTLSRPQTNQSDINRFRHQRISSQQNLISTLNKNMENLQYGIHPLQQLPKNQSHIKEVHNLYQSGVNLKNVVKSKNLKSASSQSMRKIKMQDESFNQVVQTKGSQEDLTPVNMATNIMNKRTSLQNGGTDHRYKNINVRKLLKIAMKK